MDELQEKIARLERRYQRELEARKQAEEILDSKSRELFDKKQKLEELTDDLEVLVQERTQELEKARDEALRAAEAKSEFISNMSHELRTPLNGVLGMLNILKKTTLDDSQQHYLGVAQNSGELLLSVINDILDFSKIQANKMILEAVPFSPKQLLEQCVEPLQFVAEEQNNTLSHHCDVDMPESIIGDPTRLKQILTNLLSNAIKFTENGMVLANIQRKENFYEIEVSDTGIGMNKEQLNHVFEAFNQADSSITRTHGGTGLGLTITNRITQMMGGSINVESMLNKGTNFVITLPLEIDESSKLHTHDHQVESIIFKNQRVLLVEDNLINQEVAEFLLSDIGLRVTCCENGAEALKALDGSQAGNDPFEVVLMDLQMPVMDGLEATRRIRNATESGYSDIPVIAMTAHASQEHKDECKAVGMNAHLMKPVDEEAVCNTLKLWLTTGTRATSTEDSSPSSQQNDIPDKLPGIELHSALSRVKNNWPLLKKLLINFIRDQGFYPPQIRLSLENENFGKAQKLLHTLKGSSANIGARELSLIAAEMEQHLKDKQPGNAMHTMSKLEQEMESLAEVISHLHLEVQAATKEIHEDDIKKQIIAIIDLLDSDFPKAEQTIQDLLQHKLPDQTKAQLEETANALESFDIDSAKAHLQVINAG